MRDRNPYPQRRSLPPLPWAFWLLAALVAFAGLCAWGQTTQRGVGYNPPPFAVSQFWRGDGAVQRLVRWPMNLSARPWAPGAPPNTPPNYDLYYDRYGIALTPDVAARHGVVHGKFDWAVSAAPHHTNYDTALEWACRERPGLLGRAVTGPWDCRVTAQELDDATATGGVASIYRAWREATAPPRPPECPDCPTCPKCPDCPPRPPCPPPVRTEVCGELEKVEREIREARANLDAWSRERCIAALPDGTWFSEQGGKFCELAPAWKRARLLRLEERAAGMRDECRPRRFIPGIPSTGRPEIELIHHPEEAP